MKLASCNSPKIVLGVQIPPNVPERERLMRRGRAAIPEVYFFQRNGYIKIGQAVDVERRISTLETGSAEPIYCIGIWVDGGNKGERALHHHFSFCHVLHDNGGDEWFLPHPALIWKIFILTGRLPKLTVPLFLRFSNELFKSIFLPS